MKKAPAKSTPAAPVKTAKPKAAGKTAPRTEAAQAASITIEDFYPWDPETKQPATSFAAGSRAGLALLFTASADMNKLMDSVEISGSFTDSFTTTLAKHLAEGSNNAIIYVVIPSDAKASAAKVKLKLEDKNGHVLAKAKTSFTVTTG